MKKGITHDSAKTYQPITELKQESHTKRTL